MAQRLNSSKRVMQIFAAALLLTPLPATAQEKPETSIIAGLYVPKETSARYAQALQKCDVDQKRTKILLRNRYGMPLIERYCQGQEASFQITALRQGVALLSMPEMGEYPSAWRTAQNEAKAKKRGLWASFQPILVSEFEGEDYPEFAWVRGRIHSYTKRDFGTYINFSNDWKTDFTLFVHKTHRRAFGTKWFEEAIGEEVDVMGAIYASYGPIMDVTHPTQVEFLR